MKYEKSCGAVLFTRRNGNIQYVIVKSRSGGYGFPKGHTEGNETETETALREIREETGICPRIMNTFRETDTYNLPNRKNTEKTVTYFLAEYENQEIVMQEQELSGVYLMSYGAAMRVLRIKRLQEILRQANTFLTKRDTGLQNVAP